MKIYISNLINAVIIENLPPRTFDDFMLTSNLGNMFMSECSQYEVSKIISELNNGKSSDISISVIKKTSDIISLILAMHFNYLMSIGKFPDELKLIKKTMRSFSKTTDLYLHFRFSERSLKKLFMTEYTITLFHREHFMTDSLVFAKITLQVMPSTFLLTILKQQSVMETMSLEFLLI